MSPRMVPLTVCARREYIAASTRLVHITTRNMFLPTDVFSILFCRCGVIYVTSSAHCLQFHHHRICVSDKSYRTLTYFRRTRGRGSPPKTLPYLSTVPNSGPLPVPTRGLPP